NHVEHTVGTIAVLGVIAAALNLEIVDVLRVELRTNIGSDIRVRHGNTIEQPGNLVSAADMQLIMHHVSAGCVVGDHRHAVGLVSAGCFGDLFTADDGGGR